MIAALTGLGSTIANSRPMQYAIGAGLLILGFLWWLGQHDRRLLQNERARAERKARKTQDKIEGELNEKSAQVERARESAPSGVDHSERVPDDLASIIFSD
ncbi:MAG: hypothetical protein AAFY24_01815 [Pseudomonadota bacterium]